jgi:hypothetical protein
MWPFGDNESDSCEHHHWGEYSEQWQLAWYYFETRRLDAEHTDVIKIEVPLEAACQHDGCRSTDRKTHCNEYVVSRKALFPDTFSDNEVEILNLLAKTIRNGDVSDIATALQENCDDGHLQYLGRQLADLERDRRFESNE